MRNVLVSIVLMSAVAVSGCAWSIGKTDKTKQEPTVGKELIDLKNAKESGAISEEEYKTLKSKIKSEAGD